MIRHPHRTHVLGGAAVPAAPAIRAVMASRPREGFVAAREPVRRAGIAQA